MSLHLPSRTAGKQRKTRFRMFIASCVLLITTGGITLGWAHSKAGRNRQINTSLATLMSGGKIETHHQAIRMLRSTTTGRRAAVNALPTATNPAGVLALALAANHAVDERQQAELIEGLKRYDWHTANILFGDFQLAQELAQQLKAIAGNLRWNDSSRLAAAAICYFASRGSAESAGSLADVLCSTSVTVTAQQQTCLTQFVHDNHDTLCTELLRIIATSRPTRASRISEDLRELMDQSAGVVTERFAIAAAIPLENLDELSEVLHELGYGLVNQNSTQDDSLGWGCGAVWRPILEEVQLTDPLTTSELDTLLGELAKRGQLLQSVAAWPAIRGEGDVPSEESRWRAVLKSSQLRLQYKLQEVTGEDDRSRWAIGSAASHPESRELATCLVERGPSPVSSDSSSTSFAANPTIFSLGPKYVRQAVPLQGVRTPVNSRDQLRVVAETNLPVTERNYLSAFMLPRDLKEQGDMDAIIEFLDARLSTATGNILSYLWFARSQANLVAGRTEESLKDMEHIQSWDVAGTAIGKASHLFASRRTDEAIELLLRLACTNVSFYSVACDLCVCAELTSFDKSVDRQMLELAIELLDYYDSMGVLDSAYAFLDSDLALIWQTEWLPMTYEVEALWGVSTWPGQSLGYLEGPMSIKNLAEHARDRTADGWVPTCISSWPVSPGSPPEYVVGWVWEQPQESDEADLRRWARAHVWLWALGELPDVAQQARDSELIAEAILDTGLREPLLRQTNSMTPSDYPGLKLLRAALDFLQPYESRAYETRDDKEVWTQDMVRCMRFGTSAISPPASIDVHPTEITVEQFLPFARERLSSELVSFLDDQNGRVPATNITWHEAAAFCNWISRSVGIPEDEWCYRENMKSEELQMLLTSKWWQRSGYRLPTLCEWNSMAGPAPAWDGYHGKAHLSFVWSLSSARNELQPVGKRKNGMQPLYDLWGNAAEWCDLGDVIEQRPVVGGSVADGIFRSAELQRQSDPYDRQPDVGFRIVRSVFAQ